MRRLNADGTTATVLLLQEDCYWVANVGDSRAVLVKRNGRTVQLSCDHRVGNFREEDNVQQRGGQILRAGTRDNASAHDRVNGGSGLTRCIGSSKLKPILSAVPDILHRRFEDDDLYVVLATNGMWDDVSNTEVGETMLAGPPCHPTRVTPCHAPHPPYIGLLFAPCSPRTCCAEAYSTLRITLQAELSHF